MTRDHKATHPTRTGILDVLRPKDRKPITLTPSPGTGCLTVLETLSLHDGGPAHWWTWARDEGAGGGLSRLMDPQPGHRCGPHTIMRRAPVSPHQGWTPR